jgi:hypothetical protein
LKKLICLFTFLAAANIFLPSQKVVADAADGPKSFSGEIPRGEMVAVEYDFVPNKNAQFWIDVTPKYQVQRTDIECSNFKAKYFVDNTWAGTIPGRLVYEENKEKTGEDLKCTLQFAQFIRKNRNATVHVEITNGNNWLAVYSGKTN